MLYEYVKSSYFLSDHDIDKSDVHCPCIINATIDTIKLIKCTICLKYQHLACVGLLEIIPSEVSYICVYCNSEENKCVDTYLINQESKNWKYVCGYRFVFLKC